MAVSPNMSHVHRALARLAMSRSRYDEAEASALRATTLNPEQAECWTTLGTVQAWGLKQAEAVDSFERALAIDPKAARVKLSLGHVHKALGNAQASIDAYRGAVAANPALGEAWWSLADLKTYRFGDDEVDAMEETLGQGDLTTRDRAAAHFALGKAFEDRGAAATAFDHYGRGNDLRRRQEAFKTDRFIEQCGRLRNAFASITAAPRGTDARPRPIFVVGLPRSGSTLVDQILSSHSRVQGTMELPHVLGYVRELERGRDGYPGCVARMTPGDLADLGERYLEETAAYRGDAPYFVDKMPNNFLHVGLIAAMLPEAIFVDSRRHPMACCFSIYKQNFARGQVFGYGLDSLAVYYRNYLTLMPPLAGRVARSRAPCDLRAPGRRHGGRDPGGCSPTATSPSSPAACVFRVRPGRSHRERRTGPAAHSTRAASRNGANSRRSWRRSPKRSATPWTPGTLDRLRSGGFAHIQVSGGMAEAKGKPYGEGARNIAQFNRSRPVTEPRKRNFALFHAGGSGSCGGPNVVPRCRRRKVEKGRCSVEELADPAQAPG